MLPILDELRELTFLSTFLRFMLATICGAVIGCERSRKRHAAGLRTHIIVCIGACSVMLLGQFIAIQDGPSSDPARLGAQVISGIGFLGAGSIIVTGRQQGQRVHGLTTAAGLWACACMGLTVGAGFYEAAVLMCVLLSCVISAMNQIDRKYLKGSTEARLYLEFSIDVPFSEALSVIREQSWHVLNMDDMKNKTPDSYGVMVAVQSSSQDGDVDKLLHTLRGRAGIRYADQV